MIRAVSIFALGALLVSPAAAAGWVSCSDTGGLATIDYFVGDQPEFTVTAVTVTAGERVWASDPANGPGDPIVVGDYYDNVAATFVDAVDEVLNEVNEVAELKLFKATEGDTTAYGGVLRIAGVGAWPVACTPSEG
jgi:hypothetical protein